MSDREKILDALSVLIGGLFLYTVSMPDSLYYALNEQWILARAVMFYAFAAVLFFQGMKESNGPLSIDVVCMVLGLAYISATWKVLQSYTYVESTLNWMQSLWIFLCYGIGSISFYGIGDLVTKAYQSSTGSAKNE